jgi:hypothetical protein
MESTSKLRPLSATKAKSGSGDIPPPYLKWTLEVGGGQPHAPAALVPRRDPVPVGGGWTDTGEEKNFAPTGSRTPHCPGCRK